MFEPYFTGGETEAGRGRVICRGHTASETWDTESRRLGIPLPSSRKACQPDPISRVGCREPAAPGEHPVQVKAA